jgi:hypothetical protein
LCCNQKDSEQTSLHFLPHCIDKVQSSLNTKFGFECCNIQNYFYAIKSIFLPVEKTLLTFFIHYLFTLPSKELNIVADQKLHYSASPVNYPIKELLFNIISTIEATTST